MEFATSEPGKPAHNRMGRKTVEQAAFDLAITVFTRRALELTEQGQKR